MKHQPLMLLLVMLNAFGIGVRLLPTGVVIVGVIAAAGAQKALR